MLSVSKLKAGYGNLPVIHDVSLELVKGETLVLLGRNGVGKTTLLKALMGVLVPTDGHVIVNGANLTKLPPHKHARAGVAYVPQGRGIFSDLTVAENLRTGLRARRDNITRIPEDILNHFPILRDRMDQKAGTFSGGQQQILALARALCGAPDLLLLDEPSEGIQPSIVHDIGDLLRTINNDLRITVLLVEQNLELARRAATRCLVMSKGQIAQSLSANDLTNEEKVFEALAT
ncbi:ABC transporter ATP-binding protein [Thalassospira lucentensis]|uniref:ABC transporter ATP-binding protein n=1 Tax=Thalassospira lucentensis TaxID=168935 RepID=UPI003AA95771